MSFRDLTPRSSRQQEAPPSGPSTIGPRPSRFRMAYFAGRDLPTLNQVRSDWCFYDSLGTLVALLCILSGVSAMLAVGYVFSEPALNFWWFGVMWAVGVVFLERVILQLPKSSDWISATVSLSWRIALSLLLAFLLAEPLVLRFHEKEINTQVKETVRVEKEEALDAIQADFGAKLKVAHAELETTRGRKGELEDKLREDRLRQESAAELGQVARSNAAAAAAATHERKLNGAIERNEHRQPQLHQKIDDLSERKGSAERKAEEQIDDGTGFEARVAALAGVIDKWPDTAYSVWGLRLLLLLLDLTPLVATVIYLRHPGSQPYEEHRIAAWGVDSLPAKRAQEAVRVEEQKIKDEARADIRVNQARIAWEAEQRIYEQTGDAPPDFGPDAPSSAMALDEFIEHMDNNGPFEHRHVDVPETLSRSGLVGLGLLGLATAIAVALGSMAIAWLAGVVLVAAGVLCAYTGGFRHAPAWAMNLILGTFLAGLVLPIFVVAINL